MRETIETIGVGAPEEIASEVTRDVRVGREARTEHLDLVIARDRGHGQTDDRERGDDREHRDEEEAGADGAGQERHALDEEGRHRAPFDERAHLVIGRPRSAARGGVEHLREKAEVTDGIEE